MGKDNHELCSSLKCHDIFPRLSQGQVKFGNVDMKLTSKIKGGA